LPLVQNNILHRIKSGDEAAFKELFLLHYAALCGYARKYINDLDQAEEVVQDLFFNLWQKKDQLDITVSIEAYLFRSVRNSCLNLLKHYKIRETYKVANQQAIRESEGLTVDTYVENELRDNIEVAIESLPTERKKIFKMNRLEGMNYKEIADVLGISIKTVEAQMSKALKYLREHLADYFVWHLVIIVETLKKLME
jgi:RNA polymerase sigma-70 factor, ECF subfamily